MPLERIISKYITEGTWSSPQTEKDAKELERLFQRPIKAKEASKMLYNLIGDDSLFDAFYEFDDEPETDVRFVVARHLNNWLKDIKPGETNTSKKSWQKDWDPKALEILRKLVKKHNV